MFVKVAAAALAVACLAGCSRAAQAEPAKPAPVAAPPGVAITPDYTEQMASDTVRKTPAGTPFDTYYSWPCDLPMTIDVAPSPGWTPEDVRAYAAYAVEYLRELGYVVKDGGVAPYSPNMTEAPAEPGRVIIAVAPYAADQVDLTNASAVVTREELAPERVTTSALVMLNASRQGTRPDIILHELGHVLGLEHRHVRSVMSSAWGGPAYFDADETATIDCR